MAQEGWAAIAERATDGLGVTGGDLVLLRDGAGRPEALEAMLLAVERRGGTPLVEHTAPGYLSRLLRTVDEAALARWDRHRANWLRQIDRLLVLGGSPFSAEGVPPAALAAWQTATARLDAIEEERHVPMLVLAVPTAQRAQLLGCTLGELEAAVLPGLLTPAAHLRAAISRAMAVLRGGSTLTIHSGAGCSLRLSLEGRDWLDDDGWIAADDRARGGVVSNLPAGSVYTTVAESATEGSLWLPMAAGARDVKLTFAGGRVARVEAAEGAETLTAMLDAHTGEPRRVSHVGIGLNPDLRAPVGWVLVDEHVEGTLFLALGENRYMGGQNASSLNIDFCNPRTTILVDGRAVVEEGRVVRA